jgi:hypothetical protein
VRLCSSNSARGSFLRHIYGDEIVITEDETNLNDREPEAKEAWFHAIMESKMVMNLTYSNSKVHNSQYVYPCHVPEIGIC